MPRSIWKGAIAFGMISIPVRLYTATENKDISFNLLHATDHARLRQKRWCPVDDREVPQDEVVRGFQYAKDQYVVLTEEDLDKLPLASKHTIELTSFVEQEQVDPVYFEKAYYLEPEEAGLKPYALLFRALEQKKVAAVAKIALRNREQLCILRPFDGMLVLETLHYPDEIRLMDEEERPKIPDVLVSKQEMAMAHSLIDLLASPFKPEAYRDEYREALLNLIEAKRKGKKIVEPSQPRATTQPADLMAALKASVEAARKEGKAPARTTRPEAASDTKKAAAKGGRSKKAA